MAMVSKDGNDPMVSLTEFESSGRDYRNLDGEYTAVPIQYGNVQNVIKDNEQVILRNKTRF